MIKVFRWYKRWLLLDPKAFSPPLISLVDNISSIRDSKVRILVLDWLPRRQDVQGKNADRDRLSNPS